MYDIIDTETILIQSLTSYLQYFKTYFTTSFQLLEHLLYPITIITLKQQQTNTIHYQVILAKLTQKKIAHPVFQYSPFLLYIVQNNKSYVDRFHMRIVQYLQYRMNNLFKSSSHSTQQKVINILNAFMSNLHKVFKSCDNVSQKQRQKQKNLVGSSNNLLLSISIGSIFMEIQLSVRNFFLSIFKYLQRTYIKDQLILQQLTVSKDAIQTHIMLPFYQYLMTFHSQQQLSLIVGYNNNSNKNNNKSPYQWRNNNHYRSKSQFSIQSFHSINSKSLRQSVEKRQFYNNKTNIRKHLQNNHHNNQQANEQQNNLKNNQYQQQAYQQSKSHNKSSYAGMLSIMQIQGIDVFSREYIMNELKVKNNKNKVIIGQFLKVYKKKEKKYKRRLVEQDKLLKKSLTLSIEMQQSITQQRKQYHQQQQQHNNQTKTPIYSIKSKIISLCSTTINPHNNQSSLTITNNQPLKQQATTTRTTNNNNNNNNNSKSLHNHHNNSPNKQSKLQSIPKTKHLTIINPIISNNNRSPIESIKDAFMYKQKEKLYFQQLKYKMNQQFIKVPSTQLQIKKDCMQIQAFKKLNKPLNNNKNNNNKIVTQQQLKQKYSQRNLSKRTTIKGSNVSSFIVLNDRQRRTNSKYSHSNSQLLSRNQLLSLNNHNNKNNLQTLSSLQGCGLRKLIPEQKVIKNLRQDYGDVQMDRLDEMIRIQFKMKRQIQMQGAVVVLPRIAKLGERRNQGNNIQKLALQQFGK